MNLEIDDWLSIYKSSGCALIPLQKGKKEPLIPWKEYEKKAPTDEEIKNWFKGKNVNFAVLCGEASNNLVVLDFDYPNKFSKFFNQEKIKQTWVVKTPHGFHVYFRSATPIKGFNIEKCLEVRSTGQYVVAPPSIFIERDNTVSEYSFISRPAKIQEVVNLREAIIKRALDLGENIREKRDFDETKWLNLRFGYKGNEPPCITELMRAQAPVGERDERALRITCYYANFCNDINLAREKLIRWYDNCEKSETDPFSLADALMKIETAQKGNYVFGCDDWLLSKYCSPCPLGESRFIEQILSSPNILNHVNSLLEDIIAGETANKQLIFLLLLSGKVKDANRKQIILLQGEAGGGKTTLANNISELFKTKRVGRFSKHALDYTDLQGYEVLYIQEIGSMDKEEQGISTLKFLSADDKGYTIEVTARDPETNEWITIEKRIPPITVITTTTRVDIDPQFSRRAWLLNVDESISQTKRIKKFKIESTIEESLISLGFQKESKKAKALRVLRKIVNRLEDCRIIIFFPETIANLLGEPKRIRVRGDYDKFFTLAWLNSFLHQRIAQQLPSNPGDIPVFLAPSTQTARMFQITREPLIAMTTDLEKRFIDLFEHMEREGFNIKETSFTKIERAKLASSLGKSPATINSYFRELAKRCSFVIKTKSGVEVHYSFTKDLLEVKKEILGNTYVFESCESLALKFLEESKKSLDNIRIKLPRRDIAKQFVEAVQKNIENEETQLRKEMKPENTHDSQSYESSEVSSEKKRETKRFRIWSCPSCNCENDEGIVFCKNCGFRNVGSYG